MDPRRLALAVDLRACANCGADRIGVAIVTDPDNPATPLPFPMCERCLVAAAHLQGAPELDAMIARMEQKMRKRIREAQRQMRGGARGGD